MFPDMDEAGGAMAGKAVIVVGGQPVTVLRQGVGRGVKDRVLVTTDWFGERLYGWTDKDYVQDEDPNREWNPAASPAQYRLARAVLSGTARETGMPVSVARELVERTPAGMRSEWSRRNPYSSKESERVMYHIGYVRGGRDKAASYGPSMDTNKIREAGNWHIDNQLKYHFQGYERVRPILVAAFERGYYDGFSGRAAKMKRVSNPADSAAAADEMYSTFHGSGPTETVEIHEEIVHHGDVAALGDLEELVIVTPRGHKVVLDFTADPPLLCSSSDGKQLLLRGGDMSIDLAAIKMNGDEWVKDVMVLGDVLSVTYHTAKTMDNGKVLSYEHKFTDPEGTKGGDRAYPVLTYDTLNNRLEFAGGTSINLEAGIVG
jgi:hypothetical protein